MAVKLTSGDRQWLCLSSDAFPSAGNGVKDGDKLFIIDSEEADCEFIFLNDMWEVDRRLTNAIKNALI